MIKSAITVSLVEEARGGPFVFWDGLSDACQQAADWEFDAIEVFAPAADAVDQGELRRLLEQHDLQLAAVGTGAGMVRHGLSLTDPDPGRRAAALAFVRSIIDFGGPFGAPAIIGSMQGKWGGGVSREMALDLLGEALNELGPYAAQRGVALLYEPLNRYETNLLGTIGDGVAFLRSLSTDNIRLLADLFHMNIEEVDLADAIRVGGRWIGHLHFVDSNRQAAGMGHLNFGPIVQALRDIDFQGYASAEALPLPDSATAARRTRQTFRNCFREN
jgi:sugar phosphate isomerase/epimerase